MVHFRRVRQFSAKPSIFAGVALIVLGVLAVIAETVREMLIRNNYCNNYNNPTGYCLGHLLLGQLCTGIWCGSLFVVFGLCAFAAGKRNYRILIIVHGVASFLSIVFAAVLIVLSGINVGMSFSDRVSPPAIRPYKRVIIPCPDSGYNDYYWLDRTTPDYWRRWNLDEQTTPLYRRQWYDHRTRPDYWRQRIWDRERTTTNYWDRWNQDRDLTTISYWRQWYDRTTPAWIDWIWDRDRTTPDYWRQWNLDGDQTTPFDTTDNPNSNITLMWWQLFGKTSEVNQGITTAETTASYDWNDYYDDDDKRKKRQAPSMCYVREIHSPWLTQLIMTCSMVLIGIAVFILSIITATTALLPFCCPPQEEQKAGSAENPGFNERQTPRTDSRLYDFERQEPKPEARVFNSIQCQPAVGNIVTSVSADDVPLLIEGCDSGILHV